MNTNNNNNINVGKLRSDMKNNALGAFYGGGFGGGLSAASEISRASDAQIISRAKSEGINLNHYRKK